MALRLAVIASLTLGLAAPAGAQPPPSGSLLFSTDREGWPPNVYAGNADGTGLKRLSSKKHEAEWTPNDERIILHREINEVSQLWVLDARTGVERLLADEAFDFAISPDGAEVVYGGTEVELLSIVNVSTGAKRVLVPPRRFVYYSGPDWSPTGDRIAFEYDFEQIWFVKSDGSDLRRFTTGGSPRWSPDGRRLAFTGGVNDDLFVMNDDGTGRRRVTNLGTYVDSVEWSPDGSKIAFSAGARGISELRNAYVVNADGSGLTRIARGLAQTPDRAVSWSPDGAWLALALRRARVDDVWIVRPDGRDLRRITQGAVHGGDSFEPQWDPTGQTTDRLAGEPLGHAIPTRTRQVGSEVRTDGSILRLAADGRRAAYVVAGTSEQCAHPEVFDFAAAAVTAFLCSDPGSLVRGLVIGRQRLAWLVQVFDRDDTWFQLRTATISRPAPVAPAALATGSAIVGDRGLVVVSDVQERWRGFKPTRFGVLKRLDGNRVFSIRRIEGRIRPLAAGGGRIATLEKGAVSIVSGRGRKIVTVRIPGCRPREGRLRARLLGGGAGATRRPRRACVLRGVSLSGHRLVVMRPGVLETYSPRSGARIKRWGGIPRQARLVDADAGLAVYVVRRAVHVLRLRDGREDVIRPAGSGPVHAQLEAGGLFYAYSFASRPRGRVVFIPRADLALRF
jgi:Tol biopolymer transport system component